jgi:hypothetical protein
MTAEPSPKPVLNMLVARQLDAMTTGNDAYLMVLLRAARKAGMAVRLVFAPTMSFSNRPWLRLHDRYWEVADAHAWPGSVLVGKTFWSLSPTVWGRFALRLVKEALRRAGMKGWAARDRTFLADVPWETEASALAEASDAVPSACAVAEYSSLGPILKRLKNTKRKAVLLHDLFAARADAFKDKGKTDHTAMTFEQEAERCAPADLLIYASLNEAQRFDPLLPGRTSVWLRPEVPEHAIIADPAKPARAVFLGTRHGGNRDAVIHLVDDIWPKVRAKAPDAKLWIVGSIAQDLTPVQAASPGVEILGRVEQLGSVGGGQSIGLAPTRIASGVSIKVAEYLRLGMSCIAYPVALEGFGPSLNDVVDVVQGADAFADRVVALLSADEERQRLGARGRIEAVKRLDNRQLIDVLKAI